MESLIESTKEISVQNVDDEQEESKKIVKAKKKNTGFKKKWLLVILLTLIVLALIAGRIFLKSRRGRTEVQVEYITEEVATRSITSSLSGSGTLQPANSYTVKTLVSGEILTASFEEGDTVEADQILYVIDSSSTAGEEKRTVKASISGRVYTLLVHVGDEVRQGQEIAELVDNSEMLLTVPFAAADAAALYVGQSANVVLDGNFEILPGSIETISGMEKVQTGNILTRDVTVRIPNTGTLSTAQYASVSVGEIGSVGSAYMKYRASTTVSAESSGTVSQIYVSEGDRVYSDQPLVYLEKSDSDYTEITAPISGTVVDKVYKTGENSESGSTLCTIYDLSYLETQLSVDELDISNVAVGQSVLVTADAVEGKTYIGVITKVSVVGSTSMGATYYPVTIRIDETDGLRAGMNVDTTIIVSQAEDVLTVPNAAVNRGSTVLVTADSPSAANALELEAPEGYVYVSVTTGESDDSYIEITSGLQLGDTVAYQKAVVNDSDEFMMGGMGMFGGGMPGGMPSGGMPSSGMPGGGMSGSRPSGGMPGGMGGGPRG